MTRNHTNRAATSLRAALRRAGRTAALTAVACAGAMLYSGADGHAQGALTWGPARAVSDVNTNVLDGCPAESPDGHLLFVASTQANGKGDIDIWAAYRNAKHEKWGVPMNLPEPVNSGVDDFCPTPLTGGRLLFVSRRGMDGTMCQHGAAHIYQTRHDPSQGWLEPEALPCGFDSVNSPFDEFSPSLVEAEGRTLLYFSSGRTGVHKIYTSERNPSGIWGPAVPVTELNSHAQDARPNVSHDGLEIVFDSTRDGSPDIWTARRSNLRRRWSAPVKLGTTINSDAAETRPWLSRDGERLYFGSTRTGNSDIYVSTRLVPFGRRR
jgi:hypothetical protein